MLGAVTSLTCSRRATPVGVTISRRMLSAMGLSRLLARRGLRLHFLDAADHVEVLLGDVVELAVEDLFEAGDRVLERHELAVHAGELRGDEERLREELLDLAGARDDELVVLAELVHAEDGDDVLKVLVLLERL